MNRTDIADAMAEQLGMTKKQANDAVKLATDLITKALADGDTVQLPGFGSFSVSQRAAREGKNPRTGEKLTIAASRNVKFKAGSAVKAAVNA